MVKKLSFLVTLFCSFLVFVQSAFATNVGYVGNSTVGQCTPYVWADATVNDDYWTSIQFGGNGSATLKMFDNTGATIAEQSYTFTASSWNATRTFSSTDVAGLKLCLDSGEEAFFMYGETSNPLSPTATFDYTEPTFDTGGTEPPPDDGGTTDPCAGYAGDIDPACQEPPPDDGTTDPPPEDGGTTLPPCPGCEMFECPGWADYMGKVDEIIAGFPTITDAIANQTATIRDEIVGQPPSLPSEPSQPASVDTYDFENSAPAMTENPDLGNSGFTLTDLENDAPVIEFREDPTGGFNIVDPVEALPDPPAAFPIPGETDAGEWQQNNPVVVTPEPPIVELHPYTPYPPEPSEGSTEPPTPGDSGGSAPVPSTETPIDGSYNYKTHPDNPDGV